MEFKHLLNLSVIDLIKKRVFINSIKLDVYLKSFENPGYSLFNKFYQELLKKDHFRLKYESRDESYTYGKDACGHNLRGKSIYQTEVFPYFIYEYMTDDGYYQEFSIRYNDKIYGENGFDYLIKIASPGLAEHLEYVRNNVPSILELFVEIAKKYPDAIKDVDYELAVGLSLPQYLDFMHYKTDNALYSRLGLYPVNSFTKAKRIAAGRDDVSNIYMRNGIFLIE